MSQNDQTPEEIRRDIEHTRANLGETLHDIEDKVSPARIAERRTEAVRSRWRRVRESVMGTSDNAQQRFADTTSSAGDRLHDVAGTAQQTVREAPQQVRRQAQGNPLAAGLIAFGGGLLLAAVLPSTEREQEVASTLRDRYEEPIRDELRSAGQEVADQMQGSVQQATEQVKSTAQDAAQQTKGEAQGSAQTVREDARSRQETVRRS